MEFKSLTNIETSFRQIRLFALVFICLCALVTGFAVWNSYSFAEKQRQKIYVLDNGKSLMLALSQDMAQNRPVEAKSHVRRFHELFFTLSPDKGYRKQHQTLAVPRRQDRFQLLQGLGGKGLLQPGDFRKRHADGGD